MIDRIPEPCELQQKHEKEQQEFSFKRNNINNDIAQILKDAMEGEDNYE